MPAGQTDPAASNPYAVPRATDRPTPDRRAAFRVAAAVLTSAVCGGLTFVVCMSLTPIVIPFVWSVTASVAATAVVSILVSWFHYRQAGDPKQ